MDSPKTNNSFSLIPMNQNLKTCSFAHARCISANCYATGCWPARQRKPQPVARQSSCYSNFISTYRSIDPSNYLKITLCIYILYIYITYTGISHITYLSAYLPIYLPSINPSSTHTKHGTPLLKIALPGTSLDLTV